MDSKKSHIIIKPILEEAQSQEEDPKLLKQIEEYLQ